MAFETYSQVVVAASEVSDLIAQNRGRLTRLKADISTLVTSMTAISNEYGPAVAAADAILAADQNNQAKQVLQAHFQSLLVDFSTLQTEVQTLDALVNA